MTTLFHLSDIHFGLEDNKALDWVKQEIAERRPQAVAITGAESACYDHAN